MKIAAHYAHAADRGNTLAGSNAGVSGSAHANALEIKSVVGPRLVHQIKKCSVGIVRNKGQEAHRFTDRYLETVVTVTVTDFGEVF